MFNNIITKENTVEKIAFDMALALASKDDLVKTPEQLMIKIQEFYSECINVAKEQKKKEEAQYAKSINLKTTF